MPCLQRLRNWHARWMLRRPWCREGFESCCCGVWGCKKVLHKQQLACEKTRYTHSAATPAYIGPVPGPGHGDPAFHGRPATQRCGGSGTNHSLAATHAVGGLVWWITPAFTNLFETTGAGSISVRGFCMHGDPLPTTCQARKREGPDQWLYAGCTGPVQLRLYQL